LWQTYSSQWAQLATPRAMPQGRMSHLRQ
jgi:hypothetical protein